MKVLYCISYIVYDGTEEVTRFVESEEFDIPKNKEDFDNIVNECYLKTSDSYARNAQLNDPSVAILSINQITTLESLQQLMNFQHKTPASLGLGDK